MTRLTAAKFYTRISGVMAMYKRFPKREDYDRVARAIVNEYPFLKNPICVMLALYIRQIVLYK